MEEVVRQGPDHTGLEPENQEPQDLFEYLEKAHPVNALISRYGQQIMEVLEADRRFLRLENRRGWVKWVQRESFLRGKRLSGRPYFSIARFLENCGEEAFRAVRGDTRRLEIDLEYQMIHAVPVDPLGEAREIVSDHYHYEFEKGYVLGLEVESGTGRKEAIIVRLLVDDKAVGRFIGKGGVRIRALTSRIAHEIGMNPRIVIVKQRYTESEPRI